MKKLLSIIFAISILFVACKSKNNAEISDTLQDKVDDIVASHDVQGNKGFGKISLACNGNTYTTEGNCVTDENEDGISVMIINSSMPGKSFTINFPKGNLPKTNTSYTVVKSTQDKLEGNKISINYSDMKTDGSMIWDSDDKSGTVDFVVNSNEIKCTFANIILQPSDFYNKEAQNKPATLSGELTLNKN